jgi:hypothetical protein
MKMHDALFERLLYEEESATLDFKEEQYRFSKATDDEKSELLKDILGFANGWRRSDAYILIGVEDVRGGRGNVVGIAPTEQLNDHSVQQFVNNLTNRPVRFHYEAFCFEGKQIGIIRIEQQPRPVYLRKDFGKLKKDEVYIRRGSSTDPTKPASPDEIALMGSGGDEDSEASLTVEFAELDRDRSLGNKLKWFAEYCQMPKEEEIPLLDDTPRPIRLPGGTVIQMPALSSISMHERLNSVYYRELALYIFAARFCKSVRLVVTNTGQRPAHDVRLEMSIPVGHGIAAIHPVDMPEVPRRRKSFLNVDLMKRIKLRATFQHAGYVDIDGNDEEIKVEINCGSLQPGRRVWTDTFFLGVRESGDATLSGLIFAANLRTPLEFKLSIEAAVTETTVTLEELRSLAEPDEVEEVE